MSNWLPVPGKGNDLMRETHCYGKPAALLRVSRLASLDGFDYVSLASCCAGTVRLVCQAKATSLVEAKVIADALGKYVRHMAMRKARKDARRQIRRGCVEREMFGFGEPDGNLGKGGEG